MKIIKNRFRVSPPPYNNAGFGDLKRRKGFTLAEVFIVLTVIGVIAIAVIPPLIQNTQKVGYVSALQKADGEITQALMQLSSDYGCRGDLSCTGIFDGNGSDVMNAMKPYFNIAKDCTATGATGCFNGTYNFLNQSPPPLSQSSGGVLLADGISFVIWTTTQNCTDNEGSNQLSKVCGWIVVDINGPKPPNVFGRDMFNFLLTNNGELYPQYGSLTSMCTQLNQCWNSGNFLCVLPKTYNPAEMVGASCAARIMAEGWMMNY